MLQPLVQVAVITGAGANELAVGDLVDPLQDAAHGVLHVVVEADVVGDDHDVAANNVDAQRLLLHDRRRARPGRAPGRRGRGRFSGRA